MDLYLIRHAEAVSHAEAASDAARELTPRGIQRFRDEVRGLDRLGVRLDRVLASPLVRAAQTAELLEPLLDGELVLCPELAAPPSEELLARIGGTSAALVGHEPWMGELVVWLALGSRSGSLPFRKGGVAWLSGDPRPGRMRIEGLFAPKTLAHFGD